MPAATHWLFPLPRPPQLSLIAERARWRTSQWRGFLWGVVRGQMRAQSIAVRRSSGPPTCQNGLLHLIVAVKLDAFTRLLLIGGCRRGNQSARLASAAKKSEFAARLPLARGTVGTKKRWPVASAVRTCWQLALACIVYCAYGYARKRRLPQPARPNRARGGSLIPSERCLASLDLNPFCARGGRFTPSERSHANLDLNPTRLGEGGLHHPNGAMQASTSTH